jgi:hypothetical protein
MEYLKKLFAENSEVSSMRVMSMLALLIGSGIAFYGVHVGRELAGLSALVSVFVGSAFAGKVVQKFAEEKK